MTAKYVIFHLDKRELTGLDVFSQYRHLLSEVSGFNRFDTKQEALDRMNSLPYGEYTILEVFVVR